MTMTCLLPARVPGWPTTPRRAEELRRPGQRPITMATPETISPDKEDFEAMSEFKRTCPSSTKTSSQRFATGALYFYLRDTSFSSFLTKRFFTRKTPKRSRAAIPAKAIINSAALIIIVKAVAVAAPNPRELKAKV